MSANTRSVRLVLVICWTMLFYSPLPGQTPPPDKPALVPAEPGRYKPITEPPCSYCSTQHRKGLIEGGDRVIAWLRAAHNGGAVPLRHFLAGSRVINDTYGLFFYDPDGGYVAAYRKDYGYKVHGWRNGVLVVEGQDGTLWSALSGKAIAGPQKGKRLQRIPSLVTDWSYWLMLHPESTTYDLFDGNEYPVTALPTSMSPEARESMGSVDKRLQPLANVLGVEVGQSRTCLPLDELEERDCVMDDVGDRRVAMFWYGPTRSAVAFDAELNGKKLTFYADEISPESAPFKDRETGTRWTIAGRGVDGPLKGMELKWINSIQCRWYAWAAENPETSIHGHEEKTSARTEKSNPLQAAMLAPAQATTARINELKEQGINAVAIELAGKTAGDANKTSEAIARVQEADLALYYWIEVARCPELAEAHPEWMASLQGHPEWRRLFDAPPTATDGTVIKTAPWVPILNREAFDAQRIRIQRMLADLPAPTGVFLNDLQGAPSACGCGHPLCRWTTDYGPIKTATPLGPDAAAKFVEAIQRLVPDSEVIPVWATECEQHDGHKDGLCAGVGCFKGICWKAYTAQLMPVAEVSERIGVLACYREFQRDLPLYGETAGWIRHVVDSFQTMPPRNKGQAIPAGRIVTVLQGWDVDSTQIEAQVRQARAARTGGFLIAYQRIPQDWSPQLVRVTRD